jgi:hypothetical protein
MQDTSILDQEAPMRVLDTSRQDAKTPRMIE